MQRQKYSASFKAKIALEAIKGLKTINEIAGESPSTSDSNSTMEKTTAQLDCQRFLGTKKTDKKKQDEELTAHLYQQIGQLKIELDWVNKKAGFISN